MGSGLVRRPAMRLADAQLDCQPARSGRVAGEFFCDQRRVEADPCIVSHTTFAGRPLPERVDQGGGTELGKFHHPNDAQTRRAISVSPAENAARILAGTIVLVRLDAVVSV